MERILDNHRDAETQRREETTKDTKDTKEGSIEFFRVIRVFRGSLLEFV